MSLSITILGSGSARPIAERHPAAQAITHGRDIYLVDCGEGAQMQMERAGLPLERIRAIFITHLHADHTLGLFGLIASLCMTPRTRPLLLFAHASLEPILRANLAFFIERMGFKVVFHALPDETSLSPTAKPIYETARLTVRTIPLTHRVPTQGFIFREKPFTPNIRPDILAEHGLTPPQILQLKAGETLDLGNGTKLLPQDALYHKRLPASYAYLSDTIYSPGVLPYIEGVELLYHEATYLDNLRDLAQTTGHSTALQAATIARDAGVKRLIIGHHSRRYLDLSPLLEESRAVFPNTELAQELKQFHVEPTATPESTN